MTNNQSNAFWQSVHEHKYVAHDSANNGLDYLWLHLRPSSSDFEWLKSYNESEYIASDFNSTMSLGSKIKNNDVKLSLPSEMPDHWIFSIDSLKFGQLSNTSTLLPFEIIE